jgi:hypothetical protein
MRTCQYVGEPTDEPRSHPWTDLSPPNATGCWGDAELETMNNLERLLQDPWQALRESMRSTDLPEHQR